MKKLVLLLIQACLLLTSGCLKYKETDVERGLLQIERVFDCRFPRGVQEKLAKLEYRADVSYAGKFKCHQAEFQSFVSSFRDGLDMVDVKHPWSEEKEPILKSIKWWNAHLLENSKMGVLNIGNKELYVSATVSENDYIIVYYKCSFGNRN